MKNIAAVVWCLAILVLTFASIKAVGSVEPQMASLPVRHPVIAQVGK